MKKTILTVALATTAFIFTQAQVMPYKDSSLPVEQRVEDLLSRLTYDEWVETCGKARH